MTRNRSGFTLIELVIVVVVIGILVAIAIPMISGNKEKSYIASMKIDLRNFAVAQEAYFADSSGTYSPSTAGLGTNFRTSPRVVIAVGGSPPAAGEPQPRTR